MEHTVRSNNIQYATMDLYSFQNKLNTIKSKFTNYEPLLRESDISLTIQNFISSHKIRISVDKVIAPTKDVFNMMDKDISELLREFIRIRSNQMLPGVDNEFFQK